MIRNYYTLLHIAREIESLAGWVVDECFSQDKDTLVIRLNDGKRESFLVFISDGKYDSFYLKPGFGKARKNAVNLLDVLEGEVLQKAEVLDRSRIIKLTFLHTSAYVVLFGGSKSNFAVVSSDNTVLDRFKNEPPEIASIFKVEDRTDMPLSSFPKDMPIKKAIANSDYLFGNTYTSEIFSRINKDEEVISPNLLIEQLDSNQLSIIIQYCEQLKTELQFSEKFYVLEDNTGKKLMSPVKLQGYILKSEHNSPSEAVHRKIVSDLVEGEFKTEYTKIKNFLEKQERKLSKAIENMQDIDSAMKRETEYRHWAELLISHPQAKEKFGSSISINDWDNSEITIKLDPKLNLLDNAKRYFDKAHSTKEDIKVRKIRLPEMLEKLNSYRQQLFELEKVNTIKELGRFESGIKQAVGKRVNTKKITMEEKFRRFELGEGYVLFAGKNASNNDELTMKFANQNDVWLHARGTSGSHTIIRMDKEEKPPKHILQRAAEITAYYSGAKNAKYVPVIWTFKKYVRKPKGANTGSVVVAKETVIMAEPKLPE